MRAKLKLQCSLFPCTILGAGAGTRVSFRVGTRVSFRAGTSVGVRVRVSYLHDAMFSSCFYFCKYTVTVVFFFFWLRGLN